MIFADIIKIVTIFSKTIFKDSKKVKRIGNYVSKCNLYLYFLIYLNLLISGEKMLMSAELKDYITWFIYFLDLLKVRYNCAKFHHCGICLTPINEQPRESPSWIWLTKIEVKRSVHKEISKITDFEKISKNF